MKRIFALILTIVLMMSLLAGCTGTTVVIGNCDCPCKDWTQFPTAGTTKPTDGATPAEGALKTGLSVSTKLSDSTSATADKAGEAKYDITIAAVLVDD